ncbi:hypothetical protein [Aureispira sp. CCB-E]|uniref:hypothetical protein n=1 Tax=Aureispira sp. CCB-E TaxID=3051121 RepID=UPI002868E3AD|nr:hypothetical protein [Aureispira sp. CCB-E]WMX17086.1 hypothetical protein QP953_11950 [Aureispira sp. CCB-E]
MKENIQFLLILCLFAYVIFLQQCRQASPSEREQVKIDTIIRMDTILPPPVIVQLPRQDVPEPSIIYVDSSKDMVIQEQIDTSKHQAAQLYQDSLEDENLTLYYSSIVDGQLIRNDLDYKLKIPTQITKTIEIPKPIPMPVHSILLTAGVGGNVRSFASVRLGLQFVSAKGWSLGYDYDLLQKVHSVNLGVRLGQFGAKQKRG